MKYYMVRILINALGETERYSHTIVKSADKLNASLTVLSGILTNDIYTDEELASKINNNEAIEDDVFGFRVVSCLPLDYLTLNNREYVIVPTKDYYGIKEPKTVVTISWSLAGYNQNLTQISDSDILDEALYNIYNDLLEEEVPYQQLLDSIEHQEVVSDRVGNYSMTSYQVLTPFKHTLGTFMLSTQDEFNTLYEAI